MAKIYYLKEKYYLLLSNDKEFCTNIKRPYYVIKLLNYKNWKISVAIPLRGNINIRFQKDINAYLKVNPTEHTLIKKGNISGWHILKMVPFKSNYMRIAKIKNSLLIKSIKIANQNKKELIIKCNLMLKRFESGTKVFGAINFDYYVNLLYKDK